MQFILLSFIDIYNYLWIVIEYPLSENILPKLFVFDESDEYDEYTGLYPEQPIYSPQHDDGSIFLEGLLDIEILMGLFVPW